MLPKLQQADLFPLDSITTGASLARPSTPNSADFLIPVVEDCFSIRIDQRDIQTACVRRNIPSFYVRIISDLEGLGGYKIRVSKDRGTARSVRLVNFGQVLDELRSTGPTKIIVLPKGRLPFLALTLARFGLSHRYIRSEPDPSRYVDNLSAPFLDGSTLDALQRSTLSEHLSAQRPRIFNYAMGGGKSRLIAATLRAFPTHRPAIVTGCNVTDTAQLALALAKTLGEKISLVACTGGVSKKDRKQWLERDPTRADIIVGTHHMIRTVPARSLGGGLTDRAADDPVADPGQGSTAAQLSAIVASARLYVADEVDTLPTLKALPHLQALRPALFYGFTGTWGHRGDRTEQVLLDMISDDGGAAIVNVSHDTVARTGRVVPVELIAYYFSDLQYPQRAIDGGRTYSHSLVDLKVVSHDGRNRFAAELLRHVMTAADALGGTTMASVKTIEHSMHILRHLCSLEGIPWFEEDLRERGIIVHNAQLPTAKRLQNMTDLREGKIHLVVTTDTLATGFDCPFLSDVVDLTGMQEARASTQRAGRQVRKRSGKVAARHHFIRDAHDPGLAAISKRKQEILEKYFGCQTYVHPADRLPWKGATDVPLTVIASELARVKQEGALD